MSRYVGSALGSLVLVLLLGLGVVLLIGLDGVQAWLGPFLSGSFSPDAYTSKRLAGYVGDAILKASVVAAILSAGFFAHAAINPPSFPNQARARRRIWVAVLSGEIIVGVALVFFLLFGAPITPVSRYVLSGVYAAFCAFFYYVGTLVFVPKILGPAIPLGRRWIHLRSSESRGQQAT